jgi:DNA-binding MarR family transcriptional regulator
LSDNGSEKSDQAALGELWFQTFNEIGIINQLSTTEFNKVMPHGLTNAQFSVLNHCVRLGDNKTPAKLADAFQVTRGTLTTTLKRLEAKAFITLVPDVMDGRSKRVFLTDKGRQANENAIAATDPLLAELIGNLPRSLLDALLPPLQELRVYLDDRRSK